MSKVSCHISSTVLLLNLISPSCLQIHAFGDDFVLEMKNKSHVGIWVRGHKWLDSENIWSLHLQPQFCTLRTDSCQSRLFYPLNFFFCGIASLCVTYTILHIFTRVQLSQLIVCAVPDALLLKSLASGWWWTKTLDDFRKLVMMFVMNIWFIVPESSGRCRFSPMN